MFEGVVSSSLTAQHVECLRLVELQRRLGVSEAIVRLKKRCASMGVVERRRVRQLEDENSRLKQVVADLTMDKQMLQQVLQREPEVRPASRDTMRHRPAAQPMPGLTLRSRRLRSQRPGPCIVYTSVMPWFFSGTVRMRLPVAAKNAFRTAGAATQIVGSPTPPQNPPDGMMIDSTFGIWAIRIES
jgi:putative transposase